MKKLLTGVSIVAVLLGAFFLSANFASAHQSGCHRWHSCPSDSGSYTCGDLGYPCIYPTYSTSGNTSSYYAPIIYPTYQQVAGCSVLANTFDEVNNINRIYLDEYGRNATCGELTFQVDHKTSHDTLRKWLKSQPAGKQNQIRQKLLKKYEGKTIFDSLTSSYYLIQNGVRRYIPDDKTMRANGLLYKDVITLSSNNVRLIPSGSELENPAVNDYSAPSEPTEYFITNKSGTRYLTNGWFSYKRPLFAWTGAKDDVRLDGYFVALSRNSGDDPEITGMYIQTNKWWVPARYFSDKGEYYVLVKPVDANGNRGNITYLTYHYDPAGSFVKD